MRIFEALPATLSFIMKRLDLNQAELAERSGIAKGQISGYLTGKVVPQLPQLDRLIAALGIDPTLFFVVAKRMRSLERQLDYRPSGHRLRSEDPLLELLLEFALEAMDGVEADGGEGDGGERGGGERDGGDAGRTGLPREVMLQRLLRAQRLSLESLHLIADLLAELAGPQRRGDAG